MLTALETLLANNQSALSSEELEQWLETASENEKVIIAGRLGLPAECLRKLSADKSARVRQVVAERADLPEDVRSVMIKKESKADVLEALLNGPVDLAVLEELVDGGKTTVLRVLLKKRKNCGLGRSERCDAAVLGHFLNNPNKKDLLNLISALEKVKPTTAQLLDQNKLASLLVTTPAGRRKLTTVLANNPTWVGLWNAVLDEVSKTGDRFDKEEIGSSIQRAWRQVGTSGRMSTDAELGKRISSWQEPLGEELDAEPSAAEWEDWERDWPTLAGDILGEADARALLALRPKLLEELDEGCYEYHLMISATTKLFKNPNAALDFKLGLIGDLAIAGYISHEACTVLVGATDWDKNLDAKALLHQLRALAKVHYKHPEWAEEDARKLRTTLMEFYLACLTRPSTTRSEDSEKELWDGLNRMQDQGELETGMRGTELLVHRLAWNWPELTSVKALKDSGWASCPGAQWLVSSIHNLAGTYGQDARILAGALLENWNGNAKDLVDAVGDQLGMQKQTNKEATRTVRTRTRPARSLGH